MPGGVERKGEATLLEGRCKEKAVWAEVLMAYGCMCHLREEALAEQPVPMASSRQTCTQPAAMVMPANEVLGSARNKSVTETEDAVRPLIRSGTAARLPAAERGW